MKRETLLPGAIALMLTLAACAPTDAGEAAAGDEMVAEEATAAAPTAQSELLADLADVRGKYVGLAEAVPESAYGWRPGDGVRSVSEVYMHVAAANFGIVSRVLGSTPPEGADPRVVWSGCRVDHGQGDHRPGARSFLRLHGRNDRGHVGRTDDGSHGPVWPFTERPWGTDLHAVPLPRAPRPVDRLRAQQRRGAAMVDVRVLFLVGQEDARVPMPQSVEPTHLSTWRRGRATGGGNCGTGYTRPTSNSTGSRGGSWRENGNGNKLLWTRLRTVRCPSHEDGEVDRWSRRGDLRPGVVRER